MLRSRRGPASARSTKSEGVFPGTPAKRAASKRNVARQRSHSASDARKSRNGRHRAAFRVKLNCGPWFRPLYRR